MKGLLLAVVAVIVIAAIAAQLHTARRRNEDQREKPRRKEPLTEREQAMYFRLKEALPECVVLAQVAFSAILDARSRATRNTFDRKVADFVICNRSFKVIAAIELDDSTHDDKKQKDGKRDDMLKRSGLSVLRYRQIPSTDQIRKDIEGLEGVKSEKPKLVIHQKW
ncbi:MAG: DUF2726 domain-containing protein [Acidobacteriaceae bacterium]